MTRGPAIRRALGAVLLLLAACSSGSAAPSGAPSATPDGPPVAGGECRPIDLRTPSGELIDLTGTWEGGIFVHHVRQVGDCVWWIGYARWPGTELGDLATLTFFGRLKPDFSLSGQWATIVRPGAPAAYYAGPSDGQVAFVVEFDPETGTATHLTRVGADTNRTYHSDDLRWVGELPDSANPPQQ